MVQRVPIEKSTVGTIPIRDIIYLRIVQIQRKKSLVLTLSLLVLCVIRAAAQFDQTALENKTQPDSGKVGELHLNFYNFNYVRNYEYFNGFQDGYTLYGSQLLPQFTYYAHPNLAVTAGGFFRKDFGTPGIFKAQPLFSLKYKKRDLSLIFGVLEGNIEHHYIEPIFDFERKITDPIQYGTQLKIERSRFFLDSWIAWERMIYKPSPVKEQIAGGVSAEVAIIDKSNGKLTIPVQFLAFHEGGQIDVKNNVPLSTLLNGAIGVKFLRSMPDHTLIKGFFAEGYLVGYKDFSPIHQRPFVQGSALWTQLGIQTRFGSFAASYWNGNGYISIKGTPIFQSVSSQINHTGYVEDKRELLMFKYVYQRKLIPNLYLDVRFEPVIDLKSPLSKQVDFSNSFFLTYKEDFNFGKIKK